MSFSAGSEFNATAVEADQVTTREEGCLKTIEPYD